MAHMIVIYETPADQTAFETHYFATHVPLAKRMPGLQSYVVNEGAITPLVDARPVYRIGVLTFASMETLRAAFASPEGQAAGDDRRIMAPDGSGVHIYLFEDRAL